MNMRRWMGVGATAALFAGGCAAHPGEARPADGVRPAVPTAAPSATPDEPRWEADRSHATPPQQLADRTAAYAQAVEGGPPAVTHRSGVQFNAPVGSPATASPAVVVVGPPSPTPLVTSPTAGPVPPDPRAAVLGSAVRNSALADAPQEVPESADFPAPAGAAPLDPLGVRLAKRARQRPTDPVAQLDYQLYLQLGTTAGGADPSEPQLAAAANLPADEREVVASVVDGVANFRSGVRADPNLTPTQQIRPLQDMLERLRGVADLSIGPVALCRQVSTFGRYEPIAPARFPLGRTSQVIVYCEVDNFLPRQRPDGQWETRLAEQVSLYSAAGSPVWEDKPRSVSDVCRDRRRDFYAYEKVALPSTLAPGDYRLKVTVTDRTANKVAESDVPLAIGGVATNAD